MAGHDKAPPSLPEFLRGIPKSIIRQVDPAEALHAALAASKHERWSALIIAFGSVDSYLLAAARSQRRVNRAMAAARSMRRWGSTTLFADVHFGLISWARVTKLMRFVNRETTYRRSGLALRPYNSRLDDRVNARDHLEHLEERLPGVRGRRTPANPNDVLNLDGHVLTYGGRRVEVGSAGLHLLRTIVGEWRDAVRLDALEALAQVDQTWARLLVRRARDRIRDSRVQKRMAHLTSGGSMGG